MEINLFLEEFNLTIVDFKASLKKMIKENSILSTGEMVSIRLFINYF